MFDDDRVERELLRREFHRNEMDTEVWKYKFPDVSFTDKVIVVFEDDSAMVFRHLYHDDAVLYDINWECVKECYDV